MEQIDGKTSASTKLKYFMSVVNNLFDIVDHVGNLNRLSFLGIPLNFTLVKFLRIAY